MNQFQFKKGHVIICIGSGGVGKTTFSAGLGAKAASLGYKVLVLTIDPSKRLAQTLGIEGHTDIVKVPGQKFKGELYASVVDHKKTFDDFIRRATSRNANPSNLKSESVEKILQNKLYQQLTTNLSGSQEFTSLEKLLSAHESGDFDLIILDTPPAKHAVDFLNAPQKISALFTEGVAKWFRDPKGEKRGILSAIVNTGTKQVLKALEALTGNDFIKELADFFVKIESHQDKLQSRVLAVHKLLVGPNTQFCLVTAFDRAKLIEAQNLAKDIRKNGYHLEYVVINRAHPLWYDPKAAFEKMKNPAIAALYQRLMKYYAKKQEEINEFSEGLSSQITCLRLPEFSSDISNLDDLKWVMDLIPVQSSSKLG